MVSDKYVKRVLLVLAAVFTMAWGAHAQEQNPKVAILPFVVHSPKDQASIQKSVEETLVRVAATEGLKVVDSAEVRKVVKPGEAPRTEEQARALGRRLGAGYVLFGSFNMLGNTISLDAKLSDVSGQKRTANLFAEEKGIENLAAASSRIVQQMTMAATSKGVIADIKVRGNDRIEADAIKAAVKSKKGEGIRPGQVREDIRAIYKLGYFEKVDVEESDAPAGKVLTFVVQENPTIQEVRITGNKKIKEKDILAAIGSKAYTILQETTVTEDVQKILKLYQQKGYFAADVKSSITFPKDPRKATVAFDIKEHKKIWIKKINFRGNTHISARKLRGVMQTKKKMFLISMISERGILQKEVLDTDVDRLTVFYHDEGYMDAKVGTPEVVRKDDGFYIEIPIEEGERYKVSSVKLSGDMIEGTPAMEKKMDVRVKDHFSREKVRHDMDLISKTYMDDGYAHTEVDPAIQRDTGTKTSDIEFRIKKNEQVHIGRIFITGNTRTRDYVIRRELKIFEGDMFSASKLEKSLSRLKKLDYFEDVQIVPLDTDAAGIMNLQVKVKEKLTGSISVGGGFSSDDGLFASGAVMERNLFGRGQTIGVKAYFGEEAQRYIFSFTEPWMFGYQVAGGIDLYNWLRDYDTFVKDSTGFRLRTAYPFGQYSRLLAYYSWERAHVTDVSVDDPYIQSQVGWTTLSAFTLGFERDTTDHPFLPTRGTILAATGQYASPAFGSDSNFLKYEMHAGVYVPLHVWKFIGFLRGEYGYLHQIDPVDNPVPIYERFFLGGINNLRGFNWGDVGPRDAYGNVVGGVKYGVMTAELLFPIAEKMGIRGVVFFDAGNAFTGDQDFDVSKFRTDAGAGIRWNSPFGPLRMEIGINLDPEPGEDNYQWQFSAGAFF